MHRIVTVMRISIAAGVAGLLLTACVASTVQQEWPVQKITLPPDAKSRKLPPEIDKEAPPGSSEDWRDGLYYYCFNCSGGWDALVAQVESGLTPLGYTPSTKETDVIKMPNEAPGGFVRAYTSPSGQIMAWLFNLEALARFSYTYDGGGDYLLIVEVVQW
jgi:hypothetical protein